MSEQQNAPLVVILSFVGLFTDQNQARALEPGFPGFVRIVRLHPVHKNGRRRMIRKQYRCAANVAEVSWLAVGSHYRTAARLFSNIRTPEARDCPRLNPNWL